MSQPPGPYGPYGRPAEPNRPTPPPPPTRPYGQPGPYVPPPAGQPGPYGPPPVGQPAPSSQPPYGPPPQPPGGFPSGGYGQQPQPPEKKKGLLPWIIVGLAVLVSGVGVALVFLLTGKDDDRPSDNQAATSSSSSSSSSADASPSADHHQEPAGDLPGGAQVVVPDNDGGGQFAGSGDVALAWVQALADGDFQTAYDMSCADVQDAAAAASVGNTEDPAWELATYFYEQTLGGVGFTDGTFDSVTYQEDSNQDMAAFTLQLDNGDTFTLLVYVGPDLTVCDFF